MRNLYITTALVLYSMQIWAQNEIEITGSIVNKETQEGIPFAHVYNVSGKKGTTSNTEGRFWLEVQKGDTLQFSSIGYQPVAYIIKDQDKSDHLVITIQLDPSTMELEPVEVFAFRSEESFKQALLNVDVPLEDNNGVSLSIPQISTPRSMQGDGTGGVRIGGPISAVANLFSKEEKERKKLAEYQLEYNRQKLVRQKYNPAVVLEITGLPQDEVEDFMEFCEIKDTQVLQASEYDLVVMLNRCLDEYKKIDPK